MQNKYDWCTNFTTFMFARRIANIIIMLFRIALTFSCRNVFFLSSFTLTFRIFFAVCMCVCVSMSVYTINSFKMFGLFVLFVCRLCLLR